MDLSKILAISGKPGLFKNIAQTKSGVVVESLIDGKRFPAFAHERISSLAEISVFTIDDDLPLRDVLKKIHGKYEGGQAIDHKSSGPELKAFMIELIPDYDQERVYTSDIKKILMWYNLLVEKEMLDFSEDEKAEEAAEAEKAEEATDENAETTLPGPEETKDAGPPEEEEENPADKT
jgi:hypothetical protein